MRTIAGLIGVCILVAACKTSNPTEVNAAFANVELEPFFAQLSFSQPVAMLQAPGDNSHWYVVEQGGRVHVFATETPAAAPFVDIRDRVASGGEKGLLGMAFHPDYANNGWVYLSYTKERDSVISRFSRLGEALDPASEKILLTVRQPYSNHNGGHISFGPDGFLYVGLGDGGSAGDPLGHGQNKDTLLGALLRIDINGADPYAIPPDNPFANGGGAKEIFAWGLRNPWRWNFDRKAGDLWLADVGQDEWEEINIIERGGNYGWNIREGTHCFKTKPCNKTDLKDPLFEYSHADGRAVTGGYVYRGSVFPALDGTYFFGDFSSGKIWAMRQNQGKWQTHVVLNSKKNISSFAQDNAGELYLLDYASGKIFHLVGK